MNTRTPQTQPRLVASAITVAIMSLMAQASAQTTAPPTEAADSAAKLQRVEITGSLIKRVADETALPVSIISAAEIQARGHVELKEFLLELPESATIGSYAGTVGTLVNLRGLGQARSLTLMNGRRFANEPLTDQYVSANTVPRIALSSVETLRDGASSIYGSDAIGGVQNFITQRSFTGVKVKAGAVLPQRSGGGGEKDAAVMAGFGDLTSKGWNLYGAFEASKRDVLFRRDRPELAGLNPDGTPNTAQSPDLIAMGGAAVNGLSANQSSPANFFITRNATTRALTGSQYNPYASTGCLSPASVRTTATATTCSLNTNYLDTGTYGNETELYNTYVRGTMALPGDHQVSLEINHSLNNIKQFSNVVGINSNAYYLSLPKTSQWYPGGAGGVPVVMNGTTTIANAALASSPSTLYVRWAPIDAGMPLLTDEHINDRVVLAAEGTVMGWDYRGGLNFGNAQRNTKRSAVYHTTDLQAGLNNGTLNPFGLQDATGMAFLESSQVNDQTRRQVETRKTSLDLTLSKELFQLPGGPAMLGVGGELRRDRWIATGFAENRLINVPGASQTTNNAGANAGLVPTIWMEALPNSNQPDDTMSGDAARTISSLFGELDMPVTKELTVNAGVRADKYKYSHKTMNGLNPKIGVRYAPSSLFMVRGSANTGFRNPSLPEVFGNSAEFKNSVTFDDPLYCNSNGNSSNNPNLTAAQVCDIVVTEVTKARAGGLDLVPEKSKAFTFGFGVQPVRELNITVDYWNTVVRNALATLSVDTLVASYASFQNQFVRNADGTIASILNVKSNAGDLKASGVDLSVRFSKAVADVGTVSAGLDVAYLSEFKSRLAGQTTWISALAMSEPLGISTQDGLTGNRAQINRWRHTASIGLKRGPWSGTLSQRYQSKLLDRNETARVTAPGSVGVRDVAPYSQYNLTASYTGFKNLKLNVGVNNLTNVNPPLTNNSRYQGYLTQNADVLGRAYQVSAEYIY